jgi:hypothetical protein
MTAGEKRSVKVTLSVVQGPSGKTNSVCLDHGYRDWRACATVEKAETDFSKRAGWSSFHKSSW